MVGSGGWWVVGGRVVGWLVEVDAWCVDDYGLVTGG